MQNIYIVENKILYEILNEIKDNYKFNIFFYENEEKFNRLADFSVNNFIVIVNSKHKKIIDNKKTLKKAIYIIDNLPIKISKLIDKINTHIIRQSYENQSQISVKEYIVNTNSRLINKKNKMLKLTEKEIDIILFLNEKKKPQKISMLQNKIWGYAPEIETHTVETHIYRLRKKIKNIFLDENFIVSGEDGYSIN
jgi:DNA-binding response OmpR family regulator